MKTQLPRSIATEIAIQMIKRRRKLDFTQKQYTHIDQRQASFFESGKFEDMRLSTALSIAHDLKCSLDELMFHEPVKEYPEMKRMKTQYNRKEITYDDDDN